jgi:hypothetical protein
MAKPKKKPAAVDGVPVELITLAELARRAGTTRQSAGQWVKEQNEEGADLFIDDGPGSASRRSRKVNALNPVIMSYINDTYDRGKDRATSAAAGGAKSRSTAQKIVEFTRKLEIKNSEISAGYIPRELAFLFIETELHCARRHMRAFPAQAERAVSKALFADPKAKDKKLLAAFRQDIADETEGILSYLEKMADDFKEKWPIQYEKITAAANAPAAG